VALVKVSDDGSGMSRENRLTAALLCQLLYRMDRMGEVGRTYRHSLAVGGEDGTLRARFQGRELESTVYAKSGYLRGVLALSGYVVHEKKTYAFSIIVNDYRKATYIAKRMMDRMVQEMDRELTGDARRNPD